MYYNIYINQPTKEIDAAYTYKSDERLDVGTLVKVPFRNRSVNGIVKEPLKSPKIPAGKVLPIKKVINTIPVIDRGVVLLARYLSRYYLTSVGEVLNAIAPTTTAAKNLSVTVSYPHRKNVTPITFIEGSFTRRLIAYAAKIQEIQTQKRQVLLVLPTKRLARLAAEYLRPVLGEHAVSSIDGKSRNDVIGIAPTVIVGTRKTVFHPTAQLDLVIVDQPEHFGFFNDQKPPYTVRDVSLAIHTTCRIPLLWGDHTINAEALWQAKHQHLVIDKNKEQKRAGVVWFEGPLRLSQEESTSTLILVPFAVGMPLICPHCGTVASCPQCRASLAASRDTKAVCQKGHELPLPLCSRCHNTYPVTSRLTPEAVAKIVKEQRPNENIVIIGHKQRDIRIPRQRPLTVVATPKILDYPELTFDKVFIAGAEHWLSMPRSDAVTHLLRIIWQLRSQARHELVVQSHRSLPQPQYFLSQKSSEILLAEMKQNYQLRLPPFTRKIEFHSSKPSDIARILEPIAVETLADTGKVIAYVPRDAWPLPEDIVAQLYRVTDKVTVDRP